MAAAPQPTARAHGHVRPLVSLAGAVLLGVAVVKELRTPPRKRHWHGHIGPMPYELRKPTAARVRERLWNPKGPLFGPHVFGVGWTVNFGRLLSLGRKRLGR
jgi:hypothetical protein